MLTNKDKRLIRKTAQTVNRIGKLVGKVQDIWNELPRNVQDAITMSQIEHRSISHCLRWLAIGCTEYTEEEILMLLKKGNVI